MRAVLIVIGVVWGGSIVSLALAIAGMWLMSPRAKKEPEPKPVQASAAPVEAARPRAEPARSVPEAVSSPIEGDPGLALWRTVRASKRRLGVDESALRAAGSVRSA